MAVLASSEPGRRQQARVAASTSACRIRLSPTRKVRTPARGSRARSAWRDDAALGDDDASARHARRQPLGGLERRLEGPEIAVVDADEAGPQPERPLELGLVMHLDQHIHAAARCAAASSARGGRVVDRRHDHRGCSRRPGARFDDLIGIEHEILAQHRQARRRRGPRSGYSGAPWKDGSSVSTDRQAAPPAS